MENSPRMATLGIKKRVGRAFVHIESPLVDIWLAMVCGGEEADKTLVLLWIERDGNRDLQSSILLVFSL